MSMLVLVVHSMLSILVLVDVDACVSCSFDYYGSDSLRLLWIRLAGCMCNAHMNAICVSTGCGVFCI